MVYTNFSLKSGFLFRLIDEKEIFGKVMHKSFEILQVEWWNLVEATKNRAVCLKNSCDFPGI